MPERSIANVMQAYAEDAVDMARDRFDVELDFAPDSLAQVEAILDDYESSLPRGTVARMFGRQPSQEQVWQLARIWGAYLGEVLRRRWGGEWVAERGAFSGPDIALRLPDRTIHPPKKVYQRLMTGIEENVWVYYNVLARSLARSETEREIADLPLDLPAQDSFNTQP